ncbi:MAG TPA: phasin family protein [Telluria sp.]
MSTIPDQFSAASKSQIEAQLELIESFGARAFDGAARLVSLNIETGRAAVDSSSEALKQLAGVRDPRDLIALAKGTQDFSKMIDYGREWFSIMSDVQAGLFKAAVPAAAAAPAPAPQAREEYTPAPAPAPAREADPEAPAAHTAAAVEARTVKPSKKPVVAVKPEPEQGPAAEEKPIAKAAGKVAGKAPEVKPAAAMPKAAATQAMPHVKPVDATPPPAVFQQDLLTPKRGKKR